MTDDGSYGRKGNVCLPLDEMLSGGEKFDEAINRTHTYAAFEKEAREEENAREAHCNLYKKQIATEEK